MTYTVYARDSGRVRRGTIPYLTLDMTLVFNGVGAWKLTLPADSPKAALLVPGGGIIVLDGETGNVILSGPVRQVDIDEPEPSQDQTPNDLRTVSGVTDDYMLAARNAYPDPTHASTAQTAAANDIRTGNAETVMRAYVDANAGPSALVARRVAGLTLETNLNRGATVKASARFDVLSDLITIQAATPGGLGWRVVQDTGTNLVFKVFTPTNRASTARFSRDLGNLRSARYSLKGPDSTVAIVAGSGTGTARVFREQINTAAETAWGMRVEKFADRRDTSDTTTLDQSGSTALTDDGPTTSLELGTVDIPNMRFGDDFYLGDIVTAVVAGVPVTDVVRQVSITVNADRADVKPLVGSTAATPSNLPRIYEAVSRLIRGQAALEKRP